MTACCLKRSSGYFYLAECNLGRRHTVAQIRPVFTGASGRDCVVVVGDKDWGGPVNAGFAGCFMAARSHF